MESLYKEQSCPLLVAERTTTYHYVIGDTQSAVHIVIIKVIVQTTIMVR